MSLIKITNKSAYKYHRFYEAIGIYAYQSSPPLILLEDFIENKIYWGIGITYYITIYFKELNNYYIYESTVVHNRSNKKTFLEEVWNFKSKINSHKEIFQIMDF